MGTAGPQLPACDRNGAPLDLNLGPSELSEHHWTSAWDLPNSVSTTGPQRPDRMPEDMPDRTPDSMTDRMPEDLPDRMPNRMSEDMPEDMPNRIPDRMPENITEYMSKNMLECQKIC